MIPGPINLGQRGLSIGGRGIPQLPLQPQQQGAVPVEPRSNSGAYGLAEALQPIDIQSGDPIEAITKAIAGGLRGISAGREREREEFQTTDAARREQKQAERQERGYAAALAAANGAQGPERDSAMANALAGYGLGEQAMELVTREQPERWSDPYDMGGSQVQRNTSTNQVRPVVSPMAAMQQWQPLSPETAQAYPNLNPGDVQENAVTREIRQIPGAQQRQRATERQQRSVQSAISSIQSTDNVLSSVQSALRAVQSNPTFTTGWVGARLRGVEGSPAFDLDRTIDTIKANLGFEALSQMRAESPTGGALGNVTEIELRMLQAVIDSLDSAQSAPQLEEALTGVQRYLTGRQQRMQRMLEAYEQDFGGAVAQVPAAAPAPEADGVEAIDARIRELEEMERRLGGVR